MLNFHPKTGSKAFTLTELLVALGIIGALAALAIPSLLNNINNRAQTIQLKNVVGSIQQLANDQLLKNKTKKLSETDFASVDTLLTDSNFDIAKTCSVSDAANECWRTGNSAENKITYRSIAGTAAANAAATLRVTLQSVKKSVVLKNGTIISYGLAVEGTEANGEKVYGIFGVDVNGNEAPNMVGRDFFWVYITEKGKIIDYSEVDSPDATVDTLASNCKSGIASVCLGAIVKNGWKMPY